MFLSFIRERSRLVGVTHQRVRGGAMRCDIFVLSETGKDYMVMQGSKCCVECGETESPSKLNPSRPLVLSLGSDGCRLALGLDVALFPRLHDGVELFADRSVRRVRRAQRRLIVFPVRSLVFARRRPRVPPLINGRDKSSLQCL